MWDSAPKTILDPNWYVLTCLNAEMIEKESTLPGHKGQKYRQIEWLWSVGVPGQEPVERRSWCTFPANVAPTDDYAKIVIALGLVTREQVIEEGIHIDPAHLRKRKCRGNITNELNVKQQPIDKITDYAPIPRTARPGAPPIAPAPAPDDGDDDMGDIPF